MAPKSIPTDARPTPASEAGQKPPTDANATRQRYQLGCEGHHGSGGGDVSAYRQPTRSRQFNRRGGY